MVKIFISIKGKDVQHWENKRENLHVSRGFKVKEINLNKKEYNYLLEQTEEGRWNKIELLLYKKYMKKN